MATSYFMHNLAPNGLNYTSSITRLNSEQGVLKEMHSDEYGDQILTRFNEFRHEEMFCDFILTVDDEDFKVHRMVLAGCSDYFRALFSHGMKDSNVDHFTLTEVSLKGLKPLIDFSYTGKLKLNIIVLPEILEVATFLQMRPAIKLCQLYLKTMMNLEDSDEIVNLGVSFGLTELKEAQRRLILDNFLEFTHTKKFLDLEPNELISYLKDDSLNTTSEGKLLKCVLEWYNHDRDNREPEIHQVLEKVRYVQDGWATIDYATYQVPFTTNPKCKQILNFCTKYMQHAHQKHLVSDYRTRVRYHTKTILQIGGVVEAHQEMALEFPFLDDWMHGLQSEEKIGWGRNHYYHYKLKQWFPIGVIGTSDMRSHCPLVEVNGHALLVGGYLYTSDLTHIHQHCSNEVKVINPGPFSMWDLSYMTEPRAHHVVVATPNFVYAIGGKNESGPLRSVEQYDLEQDLWGQVPSLPKPRYDHAGASVDEGVYVSGGIEEDIIAKTMWFYHSLSGEWEEKPSMLTRRACHTMTLLDDCLIVCGGNTNVTSARCLSSVESFNLELQQWTYLTPMRKDCAGMGAIALEHKLVVVGGEDSVGDLVNVAQIYDPEEKKWTNYCQLVAPLKSAGVCAMTVKLTETGEQDRDSLAEEYDNRVHDQVSSDGDFHSDLDSDDETEFIV